MTLLLTLPRSYSTVWFGRALPEGGRIITAELEEKHAKVGALAPYTRCCSASRLMQVARANFEYAGLGDRIEVRIGPAAETLKQLPVEEPFDLVFIDADKPSNPIYYKEARRLTRKGGVIVCTCLW